MNQKIRKQCLQSSSVTTHNYLESSFAIAIRNQHPALSFATAIRSHLHDRYLELLSGIVIRTITRHYPESIIPNDYPRSNIIVPRSMDVAPGLYFYPRALQPGLQTIGLLRSRIDQASR